MKNLKENSIRVSGPIVVCETWSGENGKTIDMTDIGSKFNGVYCINNSTICFVLDHEVFVTPYTREAMSTISRAGLVEESFYVPFSNGDYPKYQKVKWLSLRKAARESYYRDYENDCAKWCDAHGVSKLDEAILERCFKMPREGVPVTSYLETTYYPACNERFVDCAVVDKLGRYCTNNGKVVFVHHDGHTYVAKGYWILDMLRRAGYKESGLFVPFSNGEQITNPNLAAKWEQVSSK